MNSNESNSSLDSISSCLEQAMYHSGIRGSFYYGCELDLYSTFCYNGLLPLFAASLVLDDDPLVRLIPDDMGLIYSHVVISRTGSQSLLLPHFCHLIAGYLRQNPNGRIRNRHIVLNDLNGFRIQSNLPTTELYTQSGVDCLPLLKQGISLKTFSATVKNLAKSSIKLDSFLFN